MNVTKIGNKILNSRILNGISSKQAGEAAATIALISTTTKDLVNCIYYTNQSLTNKKIPEEKRKFVAGIDLSNGVLNVASQATLGVVIKNQLPQMFDAIFSKTSKLNNTAYGLAKNGFVLFGTLVFAQVLLKRVLTPFIATPMAHYFKEYADKKANTNKPADSENKEAGTKPTENAVNADDKNNIQAKPQTGSLNIVSASNNSTFKSFEGLLK